MKMNWIIIAMMLVLSINLVVYLILKSLKDKDEMSKSLNSDSEYDEL